ncbi:hypothetical protein PSPO01_15812 [Paraphaeosphaeria sporulosa]
MEISIQATSLYHDLIRLESLQS